MGWVGVVLGRRRPDLPSDAVRDVYEGGRHRQVRGRRQRRFRRPGGHPVLPRGQLQNCAAFALTAESLRVQVSWQARGSAAFEKGGQIISICTPTLASGHNRRQQWYVRVADQWENPVPRFRTPGVAAWVTVQSS